MVIEPFPNDCPPDGAKEMTGEFYRLVPRTMRIGDPTTEDCWVRPYAQKKGQYENHPEDPQAHGLSVYRSLSDLEAGRGLNGNMRGKPIAEVVVVADQGVFVHSPRLRAPSHHDWWTNPYDLIPQGKVISRTPE